MKAQKAIFLDRDGTLIREAHYLKQLSQVQLLEGVGEALRTLKKAGYFLGMVTNQSGVARGYFPESFVGEVFTEINRQLSPYHVQLDDLQYCPHHPEGEPPYNRPCDCRKPEPGMIHKLASIHRLDLTPSWVLGDKLCDVQLGVNAQVRSGLMLTGYGLKEQSKVLEKHPNTPLFANLAEFVKFLT